MGRQIGKRFWLTAAVVAVLLVPGRSASAEEWRIIGEQGLMQFISVPEEHAADRQFYMRIADELCRRGQICILHFFIDRDRVSFPFSDADLAAQSAAFNLNPNTGMRRLLLACSLDPDPERCFDNLDDF